MAVHSRVCTRSRMQLYGIRNQRLLCGLLDFAQLHSIRDFILGLRDIGHSGLFLRDAARAQADFMVRRGFHYSNSERYT